MRKIIVTEYLTLDGVFEEPGHYRNCCPLLSTCHLGVIPGMAELLSSGRPVEAGTTQRNLKSGPAISIQQPSSPDCISTVFVS